MVPLFSKEEETFLSKFIQKSQKTFSKIERGSPRCFIHYFLSTGQNYTCCCFDCKKITVNKIVPAPWASYIEDLRDIHACGHCQPLSGGQLTLSQGCAWGIPAVNLQGIFPLSLPLLSKGSLDFALQSYPVSWEQSKSQNVCILRKVNIIWYNLYVEGFPSCSVVKNLPALPEPQEMRVQSLGQEDALEEKMALHSSILAWRIPRTEEPGGLQSVGSQRVGHDWSDLAQHSTYGETK